MIMRPLSLAFLVSLLAVSAFAQPADVTVAIQAPQTVDAKNPFLWNFDVINNGPSVAHNITVSATADPSLVTTCDRATIDVVYADGRASVQCYTDALRKTGTVTLHANAAYAGDTNPGNNTASRTVQSVVGPNLSVVIGAPLIDPGIPFSYSLNWYNSSETPATNVVVTVDPPAGVRMIDLPSACSESAGHVTCAVGTVAAKKLYPGQPDLTLTAIADESTNGKTLRVAVAITETEPEADPTNNRADLETRVFRTFYVTDTNGDTLGDALDQANASCRDDYPCKIAFRIENPPPGGYVTLKPARALPKISASPLSIDGTTQTRFEGDTNVDGPELFIDGSASGGEDGFVIDNPCAFEIRSLAIGNFSNAAITLNSPANAFSAFPCNTSDLNFPRSVSDNYLGVDPTGVHAAPNGRAIVFNESTFAGTDIRNNVISANRRSGIWLGRALRIGIGGNTIGLDIHHQPLGNGASGIFVGPLTSDVFIIGNYIAFNHDFGVAVDRRAVGADMETNSIFANWQIGIDIGLDGPTPKSDVPAPDVLSAQYDPATNKTVVTVATGEHRAIVNPTLTIYASDAPHPSGYGDGQYLLGYLPAFDPASGKVTFAAAGDWRGKWVSATITRNDYFGFLSKGHTPEFSDTHSTTSEFSRAVKVE
jgi:uncharacterized protein DUF11